jgi:hypothetical protein
LLDEEYSKCIKETIVETVNDNPNTELWDTIKCKVQGASIKYGFKKNKEHNKELVNLEKKVNELQSKYDKIALPNHTLLEELEETKQLFATKLEYKTRGAILRCKSRYGEKNSAYFLNLGKRNFNNKTLNTLHLDNGTVTTDKTVILNELRLFYPKLYRSENLQPDQLSTVL